MYVLFALDLCEPVYQVYCGVRVGGLQMGLKHSQNRSMPHFPHDYPDCPAGVRFQEQQEMELLEKFKRCKNFIKMSFVTPCRITV